MGTGRRRSRRAANAKGAEFSASYRISCGSASDYTGPDMPVWLADTGFSGGNTVTVTNTIDTSGVTNPAPQAVYQSERWGTGSMSYTLSGLLANTTYAIRLHFAEVYYTAARQRLINIAVNGTGVLSEIRSAA